MAEIHEILLKLGADVEDIKRAQAEIDRFQKRINSFKESVKLGMEFSVGDRIVGALTQIPAAINASIQAYGRQESAERGLQIALKNTGTRAAENFEAFKNLASQIQAVTTFGDEQIIEMETMASAMGVSSDKMEECIKGAIGLSTAYKIGLNEALKASASVLQGKTEKLNELIPALKSCETESEKLSMAERAMRNGFALAKGETETLCGALKQLSNSWGDVSEAVGEGFAPVVRDAAAALKSLADFLNKNKTLVLTLTRAFIAASAALAVKKFLNFVNALRLVRAAGMDAAKEIIADTTAKTVNTAATITNTAAIAANTAAKTANAAAGMRVASAAKGAGAAAVGAAAVSGTATVFLATALGSWYFALSQIRHEYQLIEDANKELQGAFEDKGAFYLQQGRNASSDVAENGGSIEDIWEAKKAVMNATDDAIANLYQAAQNGLDTTEIQKQLDGLISVMDKLNSSEDELNQKWNNAQLRSAEILSANEKKRHRELTDAEKITEFETKIAEKNRIIAGLKNEIQYAEGAERLALAQKLSTETDALIVIEKQRNARKKAAADSQAALEASELMYKLELEILGAQIRGDKAAVKWLENEKKIVQCAKEIRAMKSSEKLTAEEINRKASMRVKLENDALEAERKRAALKTRESAAEDYIYRIKIAQAKLRGDVKSVKRLEEARAAAGEVNALVGQGYSKQRASQMVNATRATERLADRQDAEGAQDGTAGENPRAPTRPKAPTRPRAASSGRSASDKGFYNPIAMRGGTQIKSPQRSKQSDPADATGTAVMAPEEIQKQILEETKSNADIWKKMENYLKKIADSTRATAGKKGNSNE